MKKHLAGFSLIELAIVLTIVGILVGAAMPMVTGRSQGTKIATTQTRLQDIDNALGRYLSANGALPCVAALNDAVDTPTFGKQVTDISATGYVVANDCYGAAANVINADKGLFFTTSSGAIPNPLNVANKSPGKIVMGAVPVRTLNLPDQDMTDAWGSRFVYAVTNTLTVRGGYDSSQGSIYIVDSNNNSITCAAQYAIVSYGADRAGGYTMSGASSAGCPHGAVETPNCSLPTSTFVKTLLNSTLAGATAYDDYVTFHSPQAMPINSSPIPPGMIAPFALPPHSCPGGWISYAGAGCTAFTGVSCCQKY